MTQQDYKNLAGGSRSDYGIFQSLQLARSYAARQDKLHLVVQSEGGHFVVALPRYTERLVNLGYEYA